MYEQTAVERKMKGIFNNIMWDNKFLILNYVAAHFINKTLLSQCTEDHANLAYVNV